MSPTPSTPLSMAEPPVVPDIALVAARAADDKLGEHTVVLAMGELFGVVDAFVVTSGRNDRQVRALVEEVERKVKDHDGTAPIAVEGLSDATWVLMDYGDFVVHVFAEQTRGFYDLEHLWSGAPRIAWQEPGSRQRAAAGAS
ncbi:MAG: ribosome silencing factor [Acidimicrobiales bacterium]